MIDRSAIREAAAGCREAIGLAPDVVIAANAMCERVVAHLKLDVENFRDGGVRGPGVLGTLCWENGQIHVAARLAPPEAVFVTAHEIGHYLLHPGPGTHFDRSAAERSTPHGTLSAIGYSERERLELDADAFAMELLCPTAWLGDQLAIPGTTPERIAGQVGLPPGLVLDHAVRSALIREPRRHDAGPTFPLAPAQAELATHAPGHLFVEARPGAGATAMAAGRVDHLLRRGSKPTAVVALAPSEGMVAALRDRVAVLRTGEAGLAWTGTPAGLGFEILARHADLAGRPRDFRLLDETGAFARFDEERRRIAPHLRARASFLAAFEAKERLVDPAAWTAMAERDRRQARTHADRELAAEVMEVGRVYAAYEQRLAREGAVDAADLTTMSVRLLEREPGLLAASGRAIEHVVIDGAQDLGPAALRLVHLLAEAGATVWAAGDPDRCVMRHDGARPGAMAETARALGARWMRVPDDHARRIRLAASVGRAANGESVSVTGLAAGSDGLRESRHPTSEEEALAIAMRIRTCGDEGIAPREQVLLARSHRVLKAIVRALELKGVTVAVVADLRSEGVVGDLLAVAALATGQAGEREFARVLGFPEYGIPEGDLGSARRWLATRRLPPDARISRPGRAGLLRLARDLDGFGRGTSAATVMKSWLFERSGYLRRLRQDADDARRERAMASLHHLVRIAEEHEAQRDDDHARLVKRVGRAGGLRQQSAFSSATVAGGSDAIAAMTIHASRGHAFRVVHLAGVLDGRMPVRARRGVAPLPRELSAEAADPAGAGDAELALLRVAASRATERLYVSGADRYGADRPRA